MGVSVHVLKVTKCVTWDPLKKIKCRGKCLQEMNQLAQVHWFRVTKLG